MPLFLRHIRSKPDEVIRAICDTDGLAGVCGIPRFLGGAGDIAVFRNHIEHMVKKFGAEHVAIGTDVSYVSRHEEVERDKVPKRASGGSVLALPGARWEQLWPPDSGQPASHAEASLAWTNWSLFTVGMIQRGLKDDDIRKIVGGNVLRVARANFEG